MYKRQNLDCDVVDRMKATMTTGKHHFIVVVAEGVGNSKDMCYYIEQRTGVATRLTVLGLSLIHICARSSSGREYGPTALMAAISAAAAPAT